MSDDNTQTYPPVRHLEYYFDDGSIIFLVITIFQVTDVVIIHNLADQG